MHSAHREIAVESECNKVTYDKIANLIYSKSFNDLLRYIESSNLDTVPLLYANMFHTINPYTTVPQDEVASYVKLFVLTMRFASSDESMYLKALESVPWESVIKFLRFMDFDYFDEFWPFLQRLSSKFYCKSKCIKKIVFQFDDYVANSKVNLVRLLCLVNSSDFFENDAFTSSDAFGKMLGVVTDIEDTYIISLFLKHVNYFVKYIVPKIQKEEASRYHCLIIDLIKTCNTLKFDISEYSFYQKYKEENPSIKANN